MRLRVVLLGAWLAGVVLGGGAMLGCGSVGVNKPTDVQDSGPDAPTTPDGGLDAGGDGNPTDDAAGDDAGVKATWNSTTALWDQARWN